MDRGCVVRLVECKCVTCGGKLLFRPDFEFADGTMMAAHCPKCESILHRPRAGLMWEFHVDVVGNLSEVFFYDLIPETVEEAKRYHFPQSEIER